VAGEEGILEMELCRDERDGRSVRVIVLYLSFIIAPLLQRGNLLFD
jgi:hypothetical protein